MKWFYHYNIYLTKLMVQLYCSNIMETKIIFQKKFFRKFYQNKKDNSKDVKNLYFDISYYEFRISITSN